MDKDKIMTNKTVELQQASKWTVIEDCPDFRKDFAQLCFRYDNEGVREYLIVAGIKGVSTKWLFVSENSEANKREAYAMWSVIEEEIYS
jgi:hypothetical protein